MVKTNKQTHTSKHFCFEKYLFLGFSYQAPKYIIVFLICFYLHRASDRGGVYGEDLREAPRHSV